MKDQATAKGPPASPLAVEVLCATWVLAMVALAWLELSGSIGHSDFLADQVDQLQQLDLLARGDLAGLYGPWWSGTAPPVHALGPLSALAFGILDGLGLDPDQIHMVFVWLMLASVAGFYAFTSRLDPWLALIWTSLIVGSPYFWWIGSLLWANALLVPLGLLFAAGVLAYARGPDAHKAQWLLLFVWLGLQVHSTAGIVFLVLLAVAWDVWRRRRSGTVRFRPSLRILLGLVLVGGPYLVAEVFKHGQNTRAIVANLVRRSGRDGGRGARESLEGSLHLLGLPPGPQDGSTWSAVIACIVFSALIATWLYLCGRALRRLRRGIEVPEDRLALAALLVLIGQTAFFLAVNRSIASRHYLLYGLPWIALPVALAVRYLAGRLGRALPILVLVLSGGEFAYGRMQAGNWLAGTEWNWRNMSAAMTRICADHPRIRLREPVGFVPYDPRMKPVLRYLAHRWVRTCEIQADAPVLVYPDRAGTPPEVLRVQELEWRRSEIVPPGLGVYLPAP